MDGLNYFLPGQLWQYDTRTCEENSTLTILHIDDEEDYTIIHVRLDNIDFVTGGCIQHLPFSADAIMGSVTDFVKHLDAVPDFKVGYDQWKEQYDAGKAGYWKMVVKEAVEAIEHIMNNKS
ncbi:MAG: hypothetical protein ABIO79_01810 [Ferruginibacter sp.]